MLTRTLLLAAPFLLPTFCSAQDPLQLLRQAEATFAELPKGSYDFDMVETVEFPGNARLTESRRRIAGSSGRYRSEGPGVLYVYDGAFSWGYNPNRNEYTKVPDKVRGSRVPPDLSHFQLSGYRIQSARHIGQETVQLDSGPVVCEVIEVERSTGNQRVHYSPFRYWIDPDRRLVLKQRTTVTITSADNPKPSEQIYTYFLAKTSIGQPGDEALFRFTPPEGSVLVEKLSFGPKSALLGTQSPEFTLTFVDGTKISSANLRGKVVLLSFNVGPITEPVLEMAYRAFKSSGLTGFQVVRLQKTPVPTYSGPPSTMPMALDPSGSIAKLFGFDPDGTVLIDGSGAIIYAGRQGNWVEFAKALQTAKIW